MTATPEWMAPPAPAGRSVHPRPAPPDVRLALGGWCPLDDTVLRLELTGLCCPACGAAWDHTGRHGWWMTRGVDLASRLVAEDDLESVGLLDPAARSTCRPCRLWLTPGHLDSREHWAAIAAAVDDVDDLDDALPDDLAGCLVDAGDGAVCGLPRPCPQHALRVTAVRAREEFAAAERLGRRILWTLAGGAAVMVLGTVAGVAARPFAVLPDVGWVGAGGVLVAAAAVVGVGELRRWWSGWWPFRHNRLIDMPAGGPGTVKCRVDIRRADAPERVVVARLFAVDDLDPAVVLARAGELLAEFGRPGTFGEVFDFDDPCHPHYVGRVGEVVSDGR